MEVSKKVPTGMGRFNCPDNKRGWMNAALYCFWLSLDAVGGSSRVVIGCFGKSRIKESVLIPRLGKVRGKESVLIPRPGKVRSKE